MKFLIQSLILAGMLVSSMSADAQIIRHPNRNLTPVHDNRSGQLMGYALLTPNEYGNQYYYCYADIIQRDFIGVASECQRPGHRFISNIGFIPAAFKPGRVPLYRCHSEWDRTIFTSHDPYCEGDIRDYFMGYVVRNPNLVIRE